MVVAGWEHFMPDGVTVWCADCSEEIVRPPVDSLWRWLRLHRESGGCDYFKRIRAALDAGVQLHVDESWS